MLVIGILLIGFGVICIYAAFNIGPKHHKDPRSGPSVGAQIFGFLYLAVILLGSWAMYH